MTLRIASTVAIAAALSLCASRAGAVNVLEDKDHDRALDLGVLIQPQISVTKDGAPNGNTSVDLFVRRARFWASGSVSKEFSFFFEIDEPNWGKGGNWKTDPPLVQDALISWTPDRALNVDAGFMLVPFSHQSLEGAPTLHGLDYHTQFLPFPNGTGPANRDVGIEVRGLLFNDLFYYRVGAFEGVRGDALNPPAATPPPPLNESGLPRVSGMLRFNAMGVEDKLYFGGIYFAEKTMLSIGVGGDYQAHAVRDVSANPQDYWALSGDVYFEHPFGPDDEIIAKANFVHASQQPGTKVTTNGGYVEAGYRHAWIEPIAAFELLQSDDSSRSLMSVGGGANVWVRKHQVNLKVDAKWSENKITTGGATTTTNAFIAALQAQVWF